MFSTIYLCYVTCHTQWAWVTYGQTPTKQPWTQINHSFAFYGAAFFQWLLFDHICLNNACHNLRRVINLSMYITNNTTVLCTVFTHSLFCIRNLTRSLRWLVRFLIRHNSCVNTLRAHFPWSILYLAFSSGWFAIHVFLLPDSENDL